MRFGKLFAFALMAGAVAVGGTALAQKTGAVDLSGMQLAAAGERDDDGDREGRDDDPFAAPDGGLSVAEITKRVGEQGYTEIREVEREDGGYEVTARDRDGRRVELKVDGRTGKVLRTESE